MPDRLGACPRRRHDRRSSELPARGHAPRRREPLVGQGRGDLRLHGETRPEYEKDDGGGGAAGDDAGGAEGVPRSDRLGVVLAVRHPALSRDVSPFSRLKSASTPTPLVPPAAPLAPLTPA